MSRQLALVDLTPPAPPPGAPIVECVRPRSRLRVRVVFAGKDQPLHRDWWCAFPEKLRADGRRFAVGKLTIVEGKHYYRASGPYWLLAPGGT